MNFLRILAISLIITSAIGFLTVADDLRHVGELIAVSVIGLTGVVLGLVHRTLKARRE